MLDEFLLSLSAQKIKYLRILLESIFIACLFARSAAAVPSRASELDYIKAVLAEYEHDPKLALKEYGRAIKEDPGSAFLADYGANSALELGDIKKAKFWAEQSISVSSSSAAGYRLLGRVLWAEGDLLGSETAFKKSLEIDPLSSDTVYALANLVSLKSIQRAKRILKQFIIDSPDDASETYFQLADLNLKQNHLHRAIRQLKKSIAIDPDVESIPSRYALAQAYEAEYSTAAALNEYNKILSFDPENVVLLDHLAEVNALDGREASAHDFFKRALAVASHDPDANYWLSLQAEKKKNFPLAIQYLQASSALTQDPYLSLELSYDFTQENKTKDAVLVLESAHKLWPKDTAIISFLALGYEDLKKDKEAAAVLREGLAINPNDHDMRYQLGAILDREGDLSGAEKEFKILLSQNPNDAEILNYLGYSLADRNIKMREAESLIKKALSLDPKNAAYLDSMGWVYYRESHFHKAVAQTFLALSQSPQDSDIWDHLSDIEFALHQPQRAWVALKMATLFSPDHSGFQAKLHKMQKSLSKKYFGADYLSYLSLAQDDLSLLSSSCRLSVRVMGNKTAFPALCSFRAPDDFSVEIMGPLFSPLFSMEVSSGSFSMGMIHIKGLSTVSVRQLSKESLSMIRDYLSGRSFVNHGAAYSKHFGIRRIHSGHWTIKLDKSGLQAVFFKSTDYPEVSLSVMEFHSFDGRLIPSLFEVKGKGFIMDLTFSKAQAKFNEDFPLGFKP